MNTKDVDTASTSIEAILTDMHDGKVFEFVSSLSLAEYIEHLYDLALEKNGSYGALERTVKILKIAEKEYAFEIEESRSTRGRASTVAIARGNLISGDRENETVVRGKLYISASIIPTLILAVVTILFTIYAWIVGDMASLLGMFSFGVLITSFFYFGFKADRNRLLNLLKRNLKFEG